MCDPPHCVQIQQWEQNLEKLNLDLFRLRCYQSSLQGGELPNPKGLLAVASRPSKSMLGRLGVFSVSSFHALVRLEPPPSPSLLLVSLDVCPQVCSRDVAALRSRTQSGGRLGRRGLPSSLRTLDRLSSRASGHSTSQVIRRTDRPLLRDTPCFLYRHRKRRHLRVRAAEPAPSCLSQHGGRKHLQNSTPHCSELLEEVYFWQRSHHALLPTPSECQTGNSSR